ncbi:MAG TPA: hypothetical protein ENK46_07280 [Flavobacteriia bacterium]|nr:hypothetical protein [Flavobacteriia bacterium]
MSKKPWLHRNWKWLTPVLILFSGLAVIISLAGNEISGVVSVFSDSEIYENALKIAKGNEEVQQTLGDLQPIDLMAIVEGTIKYSNNNNTVDISVRVKGLKGKGKLDISANKVQNEWVYSRIKIRIKRPKQTIKILE